MNISLACTKQFSLKYKRGSTVFAIRKMCDSSERRIVQFKIPVPWGYIAGIIQAAPYLMQIDHEWVLIESSKNFKTI